MQHRLNNGYKSGKRPGALSDAEREAEKRALRQLLHSFQNEKETLLELTLDDNRVRGKIGKFIGDSCERPFRPSERR